MWVFLQHYWAWVHLTAQSEHSDGGEGSVFMARCVAPWRHRLTCVKVITAQRAAYKVRNPTTPRQSIGCSRPCEYLWTEECFCALYVCLLFWPQLQLDYRSTPPILNRSQRFNMPVEFDIWLNLDGNLMTWDLWHPVEAPINSLCAY